MFRKITALSVLTVFIIINFSCHNYHYKSVTTKEKIETVLLWKKSKIEKAEILEVIKKSGESIDFSKQQPGKIEEDHIKGSISRRAQIEIDRSDIRKMLEVPGAKIVTVTTLDGRRFDIYEPQLSEKKVKGIVYKTVETIPLSEVKSVWLHLKEFRLGRFFASILLGYGAFWASYVAVGLIL